MERPPKRSPLLRPAALSLALGAAAALLLAGAAGAANITYIGSDGNVWLASPDGKTKKRLTDDATSDVRYHSPSEQSNGTVVVTRGNTSTAFAFFLRPTDGKPLNSWILAKSGTGSFAPFLQGQINPSGSLFVYDWRYFDFFPMPHGDERVSFLNGPGIIDPCALACHTNYVRPRWIPGAFGAGFISEDLTQIDAQASNAAPQPWLSSSGGELIDSFDVSTTGRSLIETSDPSATLSRFYLLQNTGSPPSGGFNQLCYAENFAPAGALPRWSPDASMISWEGADGVYVSPAPTVQGATCGISPKLIAPGGKEPDWGPANVPGGCAKAASAKKKKKKKKHKKKACGKKKKKKKRKKK